MPGMSFILAFVMLLSMACCSPGTEENDSQLLKSERVVSQSECVVSQNERVVSRNERLDRIIEGYAERNEFSGAALVYAEGKVLLKKGYGPADQDKKIPNTAETVFSMGSVSKLFTFEAVLRELDQGALRLDDYLSKYISDYPGGDRITVAHLLFHMSGIVDLFNDFDWAPRDCLKPIAIEKLIEKFKHHGLEMEPGSGVEYSNSGYVLLAYIVEQTSGLSFKRYMEEKIFEPAGMKNTTVGGDRASTKQATGYSSLEDHEPYLPVDTSHFVGCGNLFTTVEDLFTWSRKPFPEDALHACSRNSGYGRGYGYRAAYAPIPALDMVTILLSNHINAPMEEIVSRIEQELLADKIVEGAMQDPKKFCGQYEADAFGMIAHDVEIRYEDDRLVMITDTAYLDDLRITELHPLSSHRFVSKSDGLLEGILVTFFEDEAGCVDRLTVDLHGLVIVEKRTD